MSNLEEISLDYLEKLAKFLNDFSWIFKSSNTQYVKDKILEKNESFLNLFLANQIDLNELISLRKSTNYPNEINDFINSINSLKLNFDVINTLEWKFKNQMRKMSRKKVYEIEIIGGKIINEECSENIDYLIDLGSGLGYLDEFLFTNFNYKILSIEGDEEKSSQAIKRQQKYHPVSISSINHIHHFITEDINAEISFFTTHLPPTHSKIAICGLHPCGDLSVVALNLFLKFERCLKLILSPCCYHKMSLDPETFEIKNFPLSESLKEIVKKFSENVFHRPFLRLACQQSSMKFSEKNCGRKMFERAVVEAILSENEKVKKIQQIESEKISFENISNNYKIFGNGKTWEQAHETKFNEILTSLPTGEQKSEILHCLQALLQNSCETLVIVDRIFYVREEAKKMNLNVRISVKKLADEKLTPRCHVIVLSKD